MAFLAIIFVCYNVVALIRKTSVKNEWLPIISGGLGSTLGLSTFYAFPSITSDETVITAIAYGFFCGLAATGSNQVFKQAAKYLKDKYSTNDKE